MSDHRELLERARDRFPVPDLPLDDVIRHRDRRRVRQRILASVVGVGVFLAGVLAFSAAMQRDPVGPPGGRTPSVSVSPTETPSPDSWNDLYEVDPSTGEATRLLADEQDQTEPERSPDGSRIVYQGQTSGDVIDQVFQIFLLEADGTTHQLTDLPAGASEPTWSPDGERIAFVSDAAIHVMDADGGNLRQLTAGEADHAPDWSPDGSQIAFSRGPEDISAIWLASMDGTETRVTRSEWGDWYPAWSPNGRWIAFVRYEPRHAGNLEMNDSDLWLIRPDGSGQRRVVPGEAKEYEMAPESPDDHFQGQLTWSPEGRSIAFSGGHCSCVTFVDADSGEIRTLTITTSLWSGGIGTISWGADGTILGSRAEPDSEVYA